MQYFYTSRGMPATTVMHNSSHIIAENIRYLPGDLGFRV
jgi:hypothetical protein